MNLEIIIASMNFKTQEIFSKYRIVSADALKIIAVISMLTDHIGYVLFPGVMWLRIIGRLAFPIYCFLLVEGAVHTKNIGRYLLRLGAFALISEIPFDLAFKRSLFYPHYQNVFFTLFLGLAMIAVMDRRRKLSDMEFALRKAGTENMEHSSGLEQMRLKANSMLMALPEMAVNIMALLLAAGSAALLEADYSWYGVGIIFVMYLFREAKPVMFLFVALMLINMGWVEAWGCAALVLIALYSGKRRILGRAAKLGFYAFYPVHLLILALIRGF